MINRLVKILKEKKYVFVNIENSEESISLPMKYKATIYENIQGLIYIKILDKNDKTIFRKTSKNIDDIIEVLNSYNK